MPFACVAVYAGMLISNIEDISNVFSHSSVLWYFIYAILAVVCIVSCVVLVRYTAAEMAAVASATKPASLHRRARWGRNDGNLDRDRYDEDDSGKIEELESTTFGTFVARDTVLGSDGRQGTELGEGVARTPLLKSRGSSRQEDSGCESDEERMLVSTDF